jgi:hypothetical protein
MSSVRFENFTANTTLPTKTLLGILFVSVSALSIKAAYDLSKYFDTFPGWFVPGFILGVIILISVCLYFVVQAWSIQGRMDFITPKQSAYLWIAMILSFICTTSVHGFYPFRFDILSVLPVLDSVLRFNYLIAAIGFAISTMWAGLYIFSRWKLLAVLGLMVTSLFLLIPNDNCANQFNFWWIANVGASPLMYVPNLYAAFFVACGILGIHARVAAFFASGICIASLLLGLGHQFRIIW